MERPSQYVSAPPTGHPLSSTNTNTQSQARSSIDSNRPYPMAPYPVYQTPHTNTSTDSITTRLQNTHIQTPTNSINTIAQNSHAMRSSLSFQSSLDETHPRNGSITSTNQKIPPTQQVLSPLEQVHNGFISTRERALRDQTFTPSLQLAFVKSLLEVCSQDAYLLRYDLAGTEWDHMLTSSEVKKNQHTFVKQAIKLLKKIVSDTKDPEAQFTLASLYSHAPMITVPKKDLLEKNYDKARDLYAKAGSQGHSMALYRLGVSYELGVGTSVDDAKSLDCFERAARAGCVPAMFRLGMIHSRGTFIAPRSAQRMMYWLMEASKHASRENPHALFELAKVFERDLALGNNSSDNAFLRELDTLGYHQDEIKALHYYKEASRNLFPASQFKLGWCYEYGKLGCPIDAKKSIGWYSRAARQGHAAAEMALSGWYLTGAKGILAPNDREAFLWATKSAQTGFVKAEYALGYYYEVGLGCDKDLAMAKKYYLRAATQGHDKSIQRLKQMREQR